MNRRRSRRSAPGVALLALLATLALAGCTNGPAATVGPTGDDVPVLKVGVQKDGVRSILERSGALDGLPYRIEWSTFAFGPPIVEAVGAGAIDTGGVGDTPPIFGAVEGGKFKVVGRRQLDLNEENSLLVQPGSGIRTIKDLVGRRVVAPRGSSAHGFLLSALTREGVDPKDVKISFLPPGDSLAAFSTERADAIAIWEPFATPARQELGARRIAGGRPDEQGTLFQIASDETLADPERKAALADYQRRLRRAYAWASRNQEEWARAWTLEAGIPPRVAREAVGRLTATIGPVDADDLKAQQKLADLLADEGVVPRRVDFGSVIDRSIWGGEAAR